MNARTEYRVYDHLNRKHMRYGTSEELDLLFPPTVVDAWWRCHDANGDPLALRAKLRAQGCALIKELGGIRYVSEDYFDDDIPF